MPVLRAVTVLLLLLSWLSPVDQTVAAFNATSPGVVAAAPAVVSAQMPAIPVFPAADYALIPRTTTRDGNTVADSYTQGHLSVPAMHVTALEYSIPDPTLRDAFDVAMSFSPEFQQQVAVPFVSGGTWVVWDEAGLLGANTWAQAKPKDRLILVNPRLKGESPYTLAPILAHEAFHIVFNSTVKKGPDCYQAETDAHVWETRIWNTVSAYSLPGQGGTTGAAATDVQFDEITQARAAEAGTMAQYIADAYHRQCAL